MENAEKTEVLYNANCPVCAFEIDHYRAYTARAGLPIVFDDLNRCELAHWGLNADQAARRLYVRQGETVRSGIPAFLLLWAEMPRYRALGRVIGLPGIRQLSGLVYDYILAPVIYRWHLARVAKAQRGD